MPIQAPVDGEGDPIQAVVGRALAAQLPPVKERRDIRRRSGLALRDVGEALGVDAMSVHRWESGKTKPSIENAIAYRRLLDALREALDGAA